MKSFELCSVETAPLLERHAWTVNRFNPPVPTVRMSHAGSKPLPSGVGHLSVLIGANGTGKTQLLTGIAGAFQSLSRAKVSQRRPGADFPLQHLRYRLDGDVFEIEKRGISIDLKVNGQPIELDKLLMPERVIALATTSHDRFPLPVLAERVDPLLNIYRYMGLRDRSGRSSLLSALYSSLNNLFEVAGTRSKRRDRIAEIFNFLNYEPVVTVYYTFRIPRARLRDAGDSTDIVERLWREHEWHRTYSLLREARATPQDLREALQRALKTADHARYVSITVDLANGFIEPEVLDLQLLRRVGIMSTRAVEIRRLNGTIVDLKRASSGEMSIASTFIALAGVLEDRSLVLIDEPEVSLHPEWQAKYIEKLTQTFSGYKGCHYVLATHSPLILSDIPREAAVISLDADERVEGDEVARESADKLLAKFFKVPTTSNLYLRDQIVTALRLAADGAIESAEFGSVVANLEEMAEQIDSDEPVQKVIAALSQTRELGVGNA